MAWVAPNLNWAAGNIPAASDFNRIEGNIDILGKYDRAPAYAAASGSANAYAVTLNPAPASYYDGMCVAVKINIDNTGASTIDVNSLGAKAIKKPNGLDVSAGNLKAGSIYTLRYNGTNFILQGSDSTGNATAADVLAGKTFSNDIDTGLTGTMPNNGAVIITPSTANQAIAAGYHNGSGYVKGDANLVASNIKKDVPIFGVTGTYDAKRYATGTIAEVSRTGSGNLDTTISGLPFTPSAVVIYVGGAASVLLSAGGLNYTSHVDSISVAYGNRKVIAITANGFTYNDYWWAACTYPQSQWIAYE